MKIGTGQDRIWRYPQDVEWYKTERQSKSVSSYLIPHEIIILTCFFLIIIKDKLFSSLGVYFGHFETGLWCRLSKMKRNKTSFYLRKRNGTEKDPTVVSEV